MIRKLGKKAICILLILLGVLVLAAGLFLMLCPSLGRNPSRRQKAEYAERTDAFYDGVFHAPEKFQRIVGTDEKTEGAEAGDRRAGDEITEDGKAEEKKTELTPQGKIPVNKITELPQVDTGELTVTWFGHSTTLLQIHGMTVFIDPVLSEYSSPVGFAGPTRMAEVPMSAEELPEIDILLISHDHYDHLDYQTIKDIDAKVKNYCVPLGVENHLERWGVEPEKIHPMAWWEDTEINGLTISTTPAQHYAGRLPWGSSQTLWSGYYLQDGYHKVYYTGDTGYGEFFREIRKRYGVPKLVLTEDGQYNQRWPYSHMSPQEVLKAAEDMGTGWLIPVHWAGFVLSSHSWYDPAEQLTALAEGSEVSVSTPRIGETVHFSEIESYQEKWWRDIK